MKETRLAHWLKGAVLIMVLLILCSCAALGDSAFLDGFSEASMQREQLLAVFSAPDRSSYRGAKGKAAVSTNGPVYAAGWDGSWLLVLYETNAGAVRVGYVYGGDIQGGVSVQEQLSFAWQDAEVLEDLALTDDPVTVSNIMTTLPRGSHVTWLTTFSGWDYVEADDHGLRMRGFVRSGALRMNIQEDIPLEEADFQGAENTLVTEAAISPDESTEDQEDAAWDESIAWYLEEERIIVDICSNMVDYLSENGFVDLYSPEALNLGMTWLLNDDRVANAMVDGECLWFRTREGIQGGFGYDRHPNGTMGPITAKSAYASYKEKNYQFLEDKVIDTEYVTTNHNFRFLVFDHEDDVMSRTFSLFDPLLADFEEKTGYNYTNDQEYAAALAIQNGEACDSAMLILAAHGVMIGDKEPKALYIQVGRDLISRANGLDHLVNYCEQSQKKGTLLVRAQALFEELLPADSLFDNTIVLMSVCFGGADHEFKNWLYDHGVKAIIASEDEVSPTDTGVILAHFLSHFGGYEGTYYNLFKSYYSGNWIHEDEDDFISALYEYYKNVPDPASDGQVNGYLSSVLSFVYQLKRQHGGVWPEEIPMEDIRLLVKAQYYRYNAADLLPEAPAETREIANFWAQARVLDVVWKTGFWRARSLPEEQAAQREEMKAMAENLDSTDFMLLKFLWLYNRARPDGLFTRINLDYSNASRVLEGKGRLEGTVISCVSEENIKPVQNAEVSFYRWMDHSFTPCDEFLMLTDENGKYAVDNLPYGVWAIQADYGGTSAFVTVEHGPKDHIYVDPDDENIPISYIGLVVNDPTTADPIRMEFYVGGSVVTQLDMKDNEPVSGATVTLFNPDKELNSSEPVVTGEDGSYLFKVHPGKYTISAVRDELMDEISVEVNEHAHGHPVMADNLILGCTLSGYVADAYTYQRLPGVTVSINTKLYQTGMTDANGFWYANVDRHGSWTVHFSREHYRDGEEWISGLPYGQSWQFTHPLEPEEPQGEGVSVVFYTTLTRRDRDGDYLFNGYTVSPSVCIPAFPEVAEAINRELQNIYEAGLIEYDYLHTHAWRDFPGRWEYELHPFTFSVRNHVLSLSLWEMMNAQDILGLEEYHGLTVNLETGRHLNITDLYANEEAPGLLASLLERELDDLQEELDYLEGAYQFIHSIHDVGTIIQQVTKGTAGTWTLDGDELVICLDPYDYCEMEPSQLRSEHAHLYNMPNPGTTIYRFSLSGELVDAIREEYQEEKLMSSGTCRVMTQTEMEITGDDSWMEFGEKSHAALAVEGTISDLIIRDEGEWIQVCDIAARRQGNTYLAKLPVLQANYLNHALVWLPESMQGEYSVEWTADGVPHHAVLKMEENVYVLYEGE